LCKKEICEQLKIYKNSSELKEKYIEINDSLIKTEMKIIEEKDKRLKWKEEFARNNFDYTKLIFEILKILASKGVLPNLIKNAK